ncbi:MAG: DUF5666 domain-containing protein [Pseudomonadota bacterium]
MARRPTPLTRRHLIGLASSTLLVGCAAPAIVTRDGTRDPFEGGIGGTGIVGTLTDFGSLRINGLRVELTDQTRIVTALGPVSDSALAVGQTLTIAANRTRDRLIARHVRIDHPLVGTLAQLGGQLSVNGVALRAEADAVRRANVGDRVAVSGLWTPSGVVASRIDPAPFSEDLVAGDVSRDGPALRVGGVPIFAGAGQSFPPSGSYLVATGRLSEAGFVTERAATGRFVTGAGALRQLAVEGYLERTASAPGFRIAGLGHSFADDARLASLAQQRSIFVGPYDGLFGPLGGYPVPEGFARRRGLLRDGYEGRLGDGVIDTA